MGGNLSNSTPERPRRIGWLSGDDMYWETDPQRFSPLLVLVVGLIWILRRLSLFEGVKRIVLKGKPMPAWYLDSYLLTVWFSVTISGLCFDTFLPDWFLWVIFFIILQIVQTSVYHEIWRPANLSGKGQLTNVTYSRFRNLIISICNYVFVALLYGLVYWKCGKSSFGDPSPFEEPIDADFFSLTIAWSCGSLSIPPSSLDRFITCVLISQIVVSLLLAGVILATATGALKTTEEMPRSLL
jgi:hypothetical protein